MPPEMSIDQGSPHKDPGSSLGELARLFLRLGFTAYGGPAAHVAMMRDEVVDKRHWLDDQQFLDTYGATNLIPGPNSTEMVLHIGYLQAGWRGLVTAGVCFIGPAMLLVLVLSWAYVRYGTDPTAEWLLYGVKPVVIAIIAQALIKLGQKALHGPVTATAGIVVAGLYFLNFNPLLLLVLGGLLVMIVQNMARLRGSRTLTVLLPIAGLERLLGKVVSYNPTTLFLTFLKIGAVLYGSGYVLLAFLQADFVDRLGWLNEQQLIDAIAIGQVTPGPVFTTATFIGYILGGFPGAVLATVGIFLPSFFFVLISNPIIPRLRQSPWAGGLLDGVNAAALGLMAAVCLILGRAAFVDLFSIILGLAAAVLLFRFKTNSTWLILLGIGSGLFKFLLTVR
jgi:chromate transporter